MKLIYRCGWCLSRVVCAAYFRWRVYHPERVPLTGPVILAANHASFIDPPLVGAGLKRDINYLARESLFRFPAGLIWLASTTELIFTGMPLRSGIARSVSNDPKRPV